MIRLRLALLLLPLLLAAPLAAEEATLRYQATLRPTGSPELDEQLREASQLRALAEDAPVDAFGLIARAAAEPRQLEAVLRAEGFWAPRVTLRIAGEPAEAPGLAERLATRPQATETPPIAVEIAVEIGPRYRFRHIALRPAAPGDHDALAVLGEVPGVVAGEPARTDPVLDADAALLDRLRRAGHPLAAIADREVIVDHDAEAMDVTWIIAAGPRAAFARPTIEGDTRVNRELLARVSGRLEGEPFSPQRLERARRELLALGAFDVVRARPADRLDADGRLPVAFAVTDRPRNAAGVALAYETNFGLSGRVFYERRNLFGNAETLRLEAEVARLGETLDLLEATYRIGATLRRPGLLDGRTALVLQALAVSEKLEAYDRDAVVLAALIERPWRERWLLRGGPSFEQGRVGPPGDLSPFTLFGLVMNARYDGTDSLLDPRRGLRAEATAIPYADLDASGGFVRSTGTLSTYLDLAGDGGSVLALRGSLGSLLGASNDVPIDKRFFAGGGGSVRGYGFQRIGPRDSAGRLRGGLSLVEGSVELRQMVSGQFGVVGFLDAGSVGELEAPDFSNLRFGAGLGLRYATAIGPLRLDVGLPLNREPGDSRFGIYMGLGQAF